MTLVTIVDGSDVEKNEALQQLINDETAAAENNDIELQLEAARFDVINSVNSFLEIGTEEQLEQLIMDIV